MQRCNRIECNDSRLCNDVLLIRRMVHVRTDTNRKDDKDFNAALQKAEWAEHGATQNGATRKGRPGELNGHGIELT